MALLLTDIADFAGAVLLNYWGLVGGGVVTAVFFLVEHLTDRRLSRIVGRLSSAVVELLEHLSIGRASGPALVSVFVVVSMACATFQAWREERVLKPGPNVQYYDTVIRADQDWRLIVEDRNNPKVRFTVSIAREQLRIMLENRRGLSRTGWPRTVRVETPMGVPPKPPPPK
jgi:hypothetical protein